MEKADIIKEIFEHIADGNADKGKEIILKKYAYEIAVEVIKCMFKSRIS